MYNRSFSVLGGSIASVLVLASCGSASGESADTADDARQVLASFYPLQYISERVGGDLVEVTSLTPPGAEPHDLELAPATVAQLESADAVVYLSGFQPAVDAAVEQASPEYAVDVSDEADLAGGADEHGHDEAAEEDAHAEEEKHPGEEEHAEEEHAEEEHAEEESSGTDPHFWLDPARLASAAQHVADTLSEADPENASTYASNADTLSEELLALDEEFAAGLAECEVRTVVVSHDAYGYLADRYDLTMVGIAGLEPDTEPSPARLAEIEKIVNEEGVTTIFSETLVNPAVAETLAADLGVETKVLDPLEGLVDESADYQQVMRENLAALREALACS